MIVRHNNNNNNNSTMLSKLLLLSYASLLLMLSAHCATALPIMRDSPIQTIIVPYQRNTVTGHPYQFPRMLSSEKRQVLVPAVLEVVPRFNLNQDDMAMGSKKGAPLNFADGAYPVYYMPSNVNGKFNGKISLLEGVVKQE